MADAKGNRESVGLTVVGNPVPLSKGTLYLVATPIGNLEDITLRALRTLREVDIILCEDTRHTGRLLKSYDVRKPLLSYHRFNERGRQNRVIEYLHDGSTVALVSDAGTPGISDPGVRLTRTVWEAGYRVEVVPGPCAAVAALASSGLSTEEFHFVGFLPVKQGQRRKTLERLSLLPGTVVLYESPYRILKLIEELNRLFAERKLVVCRELTKRFEEVIRGTVAEVRGKLMKRKPKGEFVVMIGRAG
ncbi:MAG: Ribosomal RNA small subunit methyltransferase I [Verrucomicrobia subdivision 3 bacterium]|nr:Ribosomal RNA small subunit methyltransferase I [Limisphaerales bacterium]MCS1415498.1 Ribosomal RNA small subunit methyltransferase I [Limisphaerales bacterium]